MFDGPENFLKERAVQKILSVALPPEARDLNLDRFHGKSSEVSSLVTAMQSLPFLAEKRVVLVQAAELISAADGRIVSEALSQVPDSTILILLYEGKASLREAIPAQVSSMGGLITFWTPFPNQLPTWVVTEGRNRGKAIAYDAARALAEACSDLQEISNELDKLSFFVGKKARIELSDVIEHGLPDGTGDYRDLEEALWRRDFQKALHQGQLLSQMGVRPESIFPVFERVFRKLLLGAYYSREKEWNRADIYTTLGIRGKIRQNLFDGGMRAYSPDELRGSLEPIVQANMDLKTGALPGDLALTLLIVNLLGRKKGRNLALR